MSVPQEAGRFLEFGQFRVDCSSRLLLKKGEIVPLTPKVLQTLLVLIENRERLVGKDELISAVWPDTFVEEANLTQNVSVLRKTLGEGSDGRQYIETIPKRGYRFVGSVSERRSDTPVTRLKPRDARSDGRLQIVERDHSTLTGLQERRSMPRWWIIPAMGVAALVLIALLAGLRLSRFQGTPRAPELAQRQLTANPADDPVWRSSISPDGKYLAYGDSSGLHLRTIDTGEIHSIASPESFCFR